MLRIDNRAGSHELYAPLKSLGAEVELARLEHADVELLGYGPAGVVLLGIEYKTTGDLLQCFSDKRLADVQLPGLVSTYNHAWLLVEGLLKRGPSGELLVWRHGQWSIPGALRDYTAFHKHLLTLELCGGVHVVRTGTRAESVDWIRAWAGWWGVPWESHDSHRGLMDPLSRLPSPQFEPVSLTQRMAALLPGVGAKRSLEVARSFSSPRAMVNAAEETWQEIDGIGKTTARKIEEALGVRF